MQPEPMALLTVKDVQDRLKVCRTTVYSLMNEGLLRGVRIGTSRTPVGMPVSCGRRLGGHKAQS